MNGAGPATLRRSSARLRRTRTLASSPSSTPRHRPGALSDARAIAALAHEADCLVVADVVTSLGGSPVKIDEWQIDAAYSGTQKCLSCPPGLAPVTFGERALRKIMDRSSPVQSWFMDLKLLLGYWKSGSRTYHHTAPVNSLYGLREALILLNEEGLEAAWRRHRRNHEALRAGVEKLGVEFLVEKAARAPQLNTLVVRDGANDGGLRHELLERHSIEIGAGLGPLAGKVWRIGLMGHSSRRENVERFLRAFAEVLGAQGIRSDGDAAVAAARSVM